MGGTFIEALGLRRLSHHDGHGFPFLLGGTFIEAQQAQSQQLFPAYFPSFWEGLSLRPKNYAPIPVDPEFPFLLGGTFIEATKTNPAAKCRAAYFPSFWEGLSLRPHHTLLVGKSGAGFPFLLGGTFIEAVYRKGGVRVEVSKFPFLLGGTFIEALWVLRDGGGH